MRKLSTLVFALLTYSMYLPAQANIEQPCTPKREILLDGRVRITGCDGQATELEPAPQPKQQIQTLQGTAPAQSPYIGSKMTEAYEHYQIESLHYQEEQLNRNRRVFYWQDLSSKMMFWLVVVIVMTGLVLASLQFRKAEQIDISAGKEGLQLKTTLVGVVILAMSMVFLYMYLYFVYPIKPIGE